MSKHSLFIQPYFQFDDQGNVVYFPPRWLRRGPRRGYVMEARHRWRRIAARLAWPVFFVTYLATLSVLGVSPGFLVGAFEVLIYAALSDALACGMARSALAYDNDRARRDSFRMIPAAFTWADVAFAGGLWATNLYGFFDWGPRAATPLFLISSAFLLWMVHSTLKNRRELANTPCP